MHIHVHKYICTHTDAISIKKKHSPQHTLLSASTTCRCTSLVLCCSLSHPQPCNVSESSFQRSPTMGRLHRPHLPFVLSLNRLPCSPLSAHLPGPKLAESSTSEQMCHLASFYHLEFVLLWEQLDSSRSPSSSQDLPSSEPPLQPHVCPSSSLS